MKIQTYLTTLLAQLIPKNNSISLNLDNIITVEGKIEKSSSTKDYVNQIIKKRIFSKIKNNDDEMPKNKKIYEIIINDP